jgi:hypothetical protein
MNELSIPDGLALDTEIAAIERTMGTSTYIRDEDRQARYRALISKREGHSSILPEGFSSEAPMPIASEREYAAEHGSTEGYGVYLKAMRAAADVVVQLDGLDLTGINESFDALPDEVAAACIAELASPAPPRVVIHDENLDSFNSTAVGRALSREWGSDVRNRLGTLRARVERALMRLDDNGVTRLLSWLDGLSDEAAKAVLRRLST